VAISKNEMLTSTGITLLKEPINDLCLVMCALDTLRKNNQQVFLCPVSMANAKSVGLKVKPFKRLNLIILIYNLSFQGALKRLSAINVTLKCQKSVILTYEMPWEEEFFYVRFFHVRCPRTLVMMARF